MYLGRLLPLIIDVHISEIRDSGTVYSSSLLNLLLARPSRSLRCVVSFCLLPLSLILLQSFWLKGLGVQHSTLFQRSVLFLYGISYLQ